MDCPCCGKALVPDERDGGTHGWLCGRCFTYWIVLCRCGRIANQNHEVSCDDLSRP